MHPNTIAPEGVDSFGIRLMQARQRAGLSQEEVSARLKMPVRVIRALEDSRAYVRNAIKDMPAEALTKQTKLYGRDVQQWAVLVQLVAHMNEHLGQSIAYARMNGIVPPWPM